MFIPKDLSADAKSDEDYLSAVADMESAEDKEKAQDLRYKANDPRTSPDEKKVVEKSTSTWNGGHRWSADANNLLDDVQKNIRRRRTAQEKLEEVDDVVVSNEKQEEEKQETEEIIENSPITIPVSTEPVPKARN